MPKNERLEQAINNWKRSRNTLAEAIGVNPASITQWVRYGVMLVHG